MMLLRELLETHDAVAILSEKMATRPAQVNLRAQLESYLQLSFIFMNDTHERAKAYHVDSVLKKIELYKYMASINELSRTQSDVLINNLETMLSNAEYIKIRDLIRNMRAKHNQQYAPWYKAYDANAKNLKELANIINRDDTYKLYGPLSKYAHGFMAMEGVQIDSDKTPAIRPLRLPLNYVDILNISGILSADSIRRVYSYYCTNWQNSFGLWYNFWSSEVEKFDHDFSAIKFL
ncbi:hypothetical protein SDC9_165391 [bioreactor metagenome]|uniref:Uncharacterized protein n=1 Tax=bioreactor metagenome TaxID=1076179 RepID=A0A645G1G0_9ZZZZ